MEFPVLQDIQGMQYTVLFFWFLHSLQFVSMKVKNLRSFHIFFPCPQFVHQ